MDEKVGRHGACADAEPQRRPAALRDRDLDSGMAVRCVHATVHPAAAPRNALELPGCIRFQVCSASPQGVPSLGQVALLPTMAATRWPSCTQVADWTAPAFHRPGSTRFERLSELGLAAGVDARLAGSMCQLTMLRAVIAGKAA